MLLALGGVAITASVVDWRLVWSQLQSAGASGVRPGRVTFDTRPAGAHVLIDGQERGFTPLTISLTPGHHDLVLRRGTDERTLPVEITAGAEVTQMIEFAAAPVSTTRLSVMTERPGARVTIDGSPSGVSPVTVENLAAGPHRISVASAEGSAERIVTTEAGVTTSVVFSSLSKGPTLEAAWLTVAASFEVTVMEHNEVVGTSASSKIMLPSGHHELDLVNSSLGYQSHKSIDIETGRTAVVRVDVRAPLNANARPWAEVVIDGTPVGVTPIAGLALTLGKHQVVFRHPEFGERRQDVVVTVQGPNRIAVDLSK